PMFRTLAISASGLSAQRQRIETIAQNMANVGVTSGPDGKPYLKRTVMMETATQDNAMFGGTLPPGVAGTITNPAGPFGSAPGDVPALDSRNGIEVPLLPPNSGTQFGVTVSGVAEDEGAVRWMYEPGHPNANAEGWVGYPEIDTTQEMVNMLDAKRIYEANASVFQAAKAMLRASLDI
ncbi:MAG: flagellar basal body rod protein FlgC, partial [Gemmatimonas sp.]